MFNMVVTRFASGLAFRSVVVQLAGSLKFSIQISIFRVRKRKHVSGAMPWNFRLHYGSRYFFQFFDGTPMKIFNTILLTLFFAGIAHAASLEDDVNRYVERFSGNKTVNEEVVESLEWMGLSDPRVFDLIERRAIEGAEPGRYDRKTRNQVQLHIRALGFSGQSKYAATLQNFAPDLTYGRRAKNALEDLPYYQKWNPIISNRAIFDAKYSDDVNRILNMLHSDDFLLKRLGAQRVYAENKDAILLSTLETEIRASYLNMKNENDNGPIDAVSWMVKALGSAKQEQYRPLLQEVAVKAPSKKIRKYADQALDR